MHANRIQYDPYIPLSQQTDDNQKMGPEEKAVAAVIARSGHLCALGFMLQHFNPQNMTISDDEAIAIQNYGSLINDIAQGLFAGCDDLEQIVVNATTFGEPLEPVN